MTWSRFLRRGYWDAERARELDAYLDIEVSAQELNARVADLLLDEHAQALGLGRLRCEAGNRRFRTHHAPRLSTTQSMHAVSACTSGGSTAGNMPTRSWFRPSLR